MHDASRKPTELQVVRSALLRFDISSFGARGHAPRIRASSCEHNVCRCEAIRCGEIVVETRTHWPASAKPHQPKHCTRCGPWGRWLDKALLCALDKHIIFPGSRVALCESAQQSLAPYATRVGERYVCCAACGGSAHRIVGTWNGQLITP